MPPAGLLPEFDGVDKADPNCVVIGDAAEKFSYQNLNEAFRVLTGLEKPVLFSLGQGYEPVETNQQRSVTQCEIYIMHFFLENVNCCDVYVSLFIGDTTRRWMV